MITRLRTPTIRARSRLVITVMLSVSPSAVCGSGFQPDRPVRLETGPTEARASLVVVAAPPPVVLGDLDLQGALVVLGRPALDVDGQGELVFDQLVQLQLVVGLVRHLPELGDELAQGGVGAAPGAVGGADEG